MIEDLESIQELIQKMPDCKEDDNLLDILDYKQIKSVRLQLETLCAQRK